MSKLNPVQQLALVLTKDEGCQALRDALEKAKDDLFEYISSLNQTGEYPLLKDREIKELFGFMLSEPMMWDGERAVAFLQLGL